MVTKQVGTSPEQGHQTWAEQLRARWILRLAEVSEMLLAVA